MLDRKRAELDIADMGLDTFSVKRDGETAAIECRAIESGGKVVADTQPLMGAQ